jgi:hypothetical protein
VLHDVIDVDMMMLSMTIKIIKTLLFIKCIIATTTLTTLRVSRPRQHHMYIHNVMQYALIYYRCIDKKYWISHVCERLNICSRNLHQGVHTYRYHYTTTNFSTISFRSQKNYSQKQHWFCRQDPFQAEQRAGTSPGATLRLHTPRQCPDLHLQTYMCRRN